MHISYLVARKLFGDDNGEKKVCPADPTDYDHIEPIVGSLTFHSFATILSGACGIFCLIITALTIARHATHFSNPVQQRQVIRILLLIPWVALFSFLIVWLENAGEYLVESLDFGCSIALSAFLLLMCDYVLSNPGGYEELFGKGAPKGMSGDSPAWLKRIWYMALQYLPVSVIVWLATCISLAAGTYCGASNSPHFAHIWITVIKAVSTVFAVLGCLKFYSAKKTQLKPHSPMLKFMAFKGIIGLNFLQVFIINILVGQKVIKPTAHLTYHDIKTSLPSLLLACEMPFFAVLMFFAFPVGVYKTDNHSPAAGPVTALVQAFNITDILSSFVRGPMRLLREQEFSMQRAMSMPVWNEETGMHPDTRDTQYRVVGA